MQILACFLLFIQSGNIAEEMVPLTFSMGLPSLVNLFWKHSQRCTQRYVSTVTSHQVDSEA